MLRESTGRVEVVVNPKLTIVLQTRPLHLSQLKLSKGSFLLLLVDSLDVFRTLGGTRVGFTSIRILVVIVLEGRTIRTDVADLAAMVTGGFGLPRIIVVLA